MYFPTNFVQLFIILYFFFTALFSHFSRKLLRTEIVVIYHPDKSESVEYKLRIGYSDQKIQKQA